MTDPTYAVRSPAQMTADGARVATQLGRPTIANDSDGAFQSRLFDLIDRRRQAGLERGQAPAHNFRVTRILDHGRLLTTKAGDILVAAHHAPHAADILGRQFEEEFEQSPELEWRVVRFSQPGLSAAGAVRYAARLRGRGVDAAPNYVVPLGYIAKAQRSFELSAFVPTPPGPPAPPPNAVQVAVVDTGVAGLRGDGWLAHVPRDGTNLDPLYIRNAQPPDTLDYSAGHGEFVAGIIEQVCPDADIRMYRAVSSDGIGDEIAIGNAIIQAADDGAQIINLSLGTQTVEDAEPVGLRTALDIVAARHPDVLVVAAAGNYGDSRPVWPAARPGVISVAALTEQMVPANWSSRGWWVVCSTVGEGIVSTYVPGRESIDVDPKPEVFGADAWALGWGTSFAAPQIVGRVALALTHDPTLTPRAALDQYVLSVTTGAIRIPDFGLAVRALPGTSPA